MVSKIYELVPVFIANVHLAQECVTVADFDYPVYVICFSWFICLFFDTKDSLILQPSHLLSLKRDR